MFTFAEVAEHYRRAAYDLKPALEREAKVLVEVAAVDARNMIGQEHAEWPALAPSTVAEKTALGYVGRFSDTDPLYREGPMRESINGAASLGADGTSVDLWLTSDDPVARYQEQGTSRIPPRPFLGPAIAHLYEPAQLALGAMTLRALLPGQRP